MKTVILKSLNNLSLKGKVLVSFTLFLIIPMLVISVFIVIQFRNVSIDRAYQQAEEKMIRTKDRITEALSTALTITDRLSVNQDFSDLLNREYPDSLEVFRAYQDFSIIRDFLAYNGEVSSIRVYMDNPTLLNNWEIIPLDDTSKKSMWYQEAQRAGGLNSWIGFYDIPKEKQSYLSLVRVLSFREYGTSAVVVVDLDSSEINSVLEQESFETLLVDNLGNVLAAQDPELISTKYTDAEMEFPSLDDPDGAYDTTINGKPFHLLVAEISFPNSVNGVHIFSLFSLSSIFSDANRVLSLGLRLIILNLVLAFTVLYSINSLLVKRLIRFRQKMDIVAQGHFHSELIVDGTDEIGELAERFNNMVTNINTLMDEIHQSNEQRRIIESRQSEMKLKMLASQINPHFLFNILEAIRMKAHLEKQPDIANIVKQLGKLMRKVLDVSGSWISISDELAIISSFLEIEKFRLDKNLEYSLDIDPRCLDVKLPPLMIQPIVENAVIHGVENVPGGGKISVRITKIRNMIDITIRDNGPGIPHERVLELLNIDEEQENSHIGLKNVHERLLLTYPGNPGLEISEPEDGGVIIHFTIPGGGDDA